MKKPVNPKSRNKRIAIGTFIASAMIAYITLEKILDMSGENFTGVASFVIGTLAVCCYALFLKLDSRQPAAPPASDLENFLSYKPFTNFVTSDLVRTSIKDQITVEEMSKKKARQRK